MKFNCDKCGLCCKNIRYSSLSTELDRGDGICKYLRDNLCGIYAERPIFCNVEAYYDKYLSKKMRREDFYEINYRICAELKKLTAQGKSDILSAKLGAE